MAFYQKYRSQTFGELVGQDHVAQTLLQSVKSDKLVHAYLLTGPRGTGKTSTARLLAKTFNCLRIDKEKKEEGRSGEPCNKCDSCLDINAGKALDVIEIDAASHTGVDDVRELIDKARLSPTKLRKKVYIIDEVHMLSKSAFNALLKTLEEPPSHVVFILATTESHKVPATIISRTQRFDFKRVSKEDIIKNLKRVCESESIKIDDASLDLIAVSASGGHRDALGLLEQVASAGNEINMETTRKILGIPDNEDIALFVGAIFNSNPEEGLKIARRLYEDGSDLSEFCLKITGMIRKVILFLAAGESVLYDTAEDLDKIKALAKQTTLLELTKIIDLFISANQLMKDVDYPMLPLEIAIIKASQISPVTAKPAVIKAESPVVSGKAAHGKDEKNDSAEKAVVPTKSAAVPVPVMEMTKDIWSQVIELTKKGNSTLAALLRDAKPEQVTDDTVIIGVKFKFHKDRISEPKNCQALEKVISEVMGQTYKVICKISESKNNILKKDIPENLEEAVAEVFEL